MMNSRIKKYVAAATLAVSVGGGGALIASNASSTIASTADAGLPGPFPFPPRGPGECGTSPMNRCVLK